MALDLRRNFVSAQYLENYLTKFHQILYKIRIGMTGRGSLKSIRKRCIKRYSKVVHNIKMPFAYSEFKVHMPNQL